MKQKQIVIITALAALTLGTTLAFGGSADGTGIVGSKHDMNVLRDANVTADTQGRVCAFCHTPHHKLESTTLLNYNPLWSHTINNDAVLKSYQTVTFDSTATGDPLTGPSRLCMSCHDGSIAVDQHYGIAGTASLTKESLHGDNFNQIAVYKSSDLSNDHPIGFDLDGINTLDPGIRAKLLAPNNLGLNDKDITVLGFKTGVGSVSIMTCASCHDVHNKDNKDTAFLYEKQKDSAFCLMCHDK